MTPVPAAPPWPPVACPALPVVPAWLVCPPLPADPEGVDDDPPHATNWTGTRLAAAAPQSIFGTMAVRRDGMVISPSCGPARPRAMIRVPTTVPSVPQISVIARQNRLSFLFTCVRE